MKVRSPDIFPAAVQCDCERSVLALGGIRAYAGMGFLCVVEKLYFHAAGIPKLEAIMKSLSGREVGDSEAGAWIINFNVMQFGAAGVPHRCFDIRGTAPREQHKRYEYGERKAAKRSANKSKHGSSVDASLKDFAGAMEFR
jgi:hypothetical protein